MSLNDCGAGEEFNGTILSHHIIETWHKIGNYFDYQPWIFSLLGTMVVGLSGILPLLFIPDDSIMLHKQKGDSSFLKILLSFAVGGLLGDVFLHLLPEAWENFELNKGESRGCHSLMHCGIWVLMGFSLFVVAEKIFSNSLGGDDKDKEEENEEEEQEEARRIIRVEEKQKKVTNSRCDNNNSLVNGCLAKNGTKNGVKYDNGFGDTPKYLENLTRLDSLYKERKAPEKLKDKSKHITGYLNLMANCIDNFTHGLAVGGSFLVSFRVGALTTFAILIHEIPHEIGDFAILLKSGFSRLDAAKAQLITATGGISGALVAIFFSGDAVETKTSWILPFTAGSFLHIGLVTVLPELLKESNSKESLKQLVGFVTGIVIMAFLTTVVDEKQFFD